VTTNIADQPRLPSMDSRAWISGLWDWMASPKPYLMFLGFGLLLGFWYLSVEVWQLPRFRAMPSVTAVFSDWFSRNPVFGLSVFTPDYYSHILASIRRVALAFALATLLGVPVGLAFGWFAGFRRAVFPIFEMLRPIPALAWVPLAIVMFSGTETAILFITFLPAFFATALNTMLGVNSIDESYIRAANCLGANRRQVFLHVVLPGSMPYIFTGLQISVGVAWFSLVAGEMISGEYGLGYVIYTGYTLVSYPTIAIGMITLGMAGYLTSAFVRMTGRLMMQWRARAVGIES
jgi:NitT/TauT family transport system permease protein